MEKRLPDPPRAELFEVCSYGCPGHRMVSGYTAGQMAQYAQAAIDAAAPGIDLEQFRWAVEDAIAVHSGFDWQLDEGKRLITLIDASPKGYARTPKAGEQIADILIEWRRNEIDAGSALAAIEAHLDACTFQPANDLNIGYEAGMRLARDTQEGSPKGGSYAYVTLQRVDVKRLLAGDENSLGYVLSRRRINDCMQATSAEVGS